MNTSHFKSKPLLIHTAEVAFYHSSSVWKGDPKGHIGKFDVFFYVLEGEVILSVDSRYYSVKAGQMAFLPKGKIRKYTQVSDRFNMYEARFIAELDGYNLMETLGITENNLVINVPDNEKMYALFMTAQREEVNRDSIFELTCSANVLSIIRIFAETIRTQALLSQREVEIFDKLIAFMQENINKTITINDLANIAHIESTYLIKKFKKTYGVPPLTYFSNMKYHTAVELLLNTNDTIESIATSLGITDVAYFSRWFKKFCSMPPTEFRRLLSK